MLPGDAMPPSGSCPLRAACDMNMAAVFRDRVHGAVCVQMQKVTCQYASTGGCSVSRCKHDAVTIDEKQASETADPSLPNRAAAIIKDEI